MLYREIIAVCSEIHTKHINSLCGQNVELYRHLVVHKVTAGFKTLSNTVTDIKPNCLAIHCIVLLCQPVRATRGTVKYTVHQFR